MRRHVVRHALSAAKPRALVSVVPETLPSTQFIIMLRDKDAEMKELRAATGAELKAERAAKDAELKAERAAKDAELKELRAEHKELRAVKDAELKAERVAAGAELKELIAAMAALRSIAERDAAALAIEKYKADTARRIIGVRASLEMCILDLWSLYGDGNKTRGTTERLQMLTAGKVLCRPLVDYVKEAAKANGLDPAKALEQLPMLYRVLSAPMHQAGFTDDVETPIEAIFNGDPLTLLLASCVYKMTRRELRLYRVVSSGEREPVHFILKEPPVQPLT